MSTRYRYRLLSSIGLLSAGIIAFQLALIQVLSCVQWYHFAYMIISVALLGFGAAGTLIAIFRDALLRRIDELLPLQMIATGTLMALVTDVSQTAFFRFDSYLLFADYSHIGKLLATYLLFFIPFFLGALAIGLVFVKHVDDIGRIYFANLLGSGAGGMVALFLIWLFFPKQLPAIIAAFPILAGLLLLPKDRKPWTLAFAGLAILIISWKCLYPPELRLSEYKDLSKTSLLPGAAIITEKSSPYGMFQTLSSPALRYGPGMSLASQSTADVKMAAFINGDWFGAITGWKRADTSIVLDFTTAALPYIMTRRDDVLVLKSGTGIDIAHALSRGAARVVAVEPNAVMLAALRNELATVSDSLLFHPGVYARNLESRTFLLTDTSHYDLIALPIVGTFGGSSGLYALQEQFLLTKEAFHEMRLKLNETGVISITSWMDYPVRNPLKILATMVEVLEEAGIRKPEEHIAAVRSWGSITFVMTRTPLQPEAIRNIRAFCEEMYFDPAILPGLDAEERTRYNQFQDSLFFQYVDQIIAPDRDRFYRDYDFNIRPATDDKPYFSQYIKWRSLGRLSGFFGSRAIPFFEIGYLMVVITFVQIAIASFLLIILPLFRIGWTGKSRVGVIIYFTGIGLGFMFVEMVFIQRFILYFGSPVYAASAVITSLLIFSGLGSYCSGYFTASRRRLMMVFGAIILMLLCYSAGFTTVLQQTIRFDLLLKSIVVFLLTAPLAFCMGIPFPAGLRRVSEVNAQAVPWAWGINGCVSVISTALATIVAVEMGFSWVMIFAALAYCMPLMVQLRWK